MFTKISQRSSFLEIVSYTIPKLYTGVCWYVGYSAFDPATGQLRRVRIKLNHIEKIKDRRTYADHLIHRLLRKLEYGWNPFVEAENSKAYHAFKEVAELYRKYTMKLYNDGNLREKTMYGYLSMLRTLEKWNDDRKVPVTYIYQFDRMLVTEFLNYIYIDKDNSIRTRNNYLTWLGIFDTYLVQNMFLKSKATEGIVSIRRNSAEKDRDVIPDKDMIRLKDYLEKNNKHFLLASYLLHYAMIRPKEMSYLKLENFKLTKQTIFIPGYISKNKKSAVVTLPAKIIHLMVELKIFDHPSSYYLFSDNFQPGAERRSERLMRDYWSFHVRKDLKFPDRYKFYSLKDTGITAMLRKCEVLSVRDQARHSSILMTNTYTPQDIKNANELLLNYDGIF
jgi:integrase